MVSIGFRASAKDVIYAIISVDENGDYNLNAVER